MKLKRFTIPFRRASSASKPSSSQRPCLEPRANVLNLQHIHCNIEGRNLTSPTDSLDGISLQALTGTPCNHTVDGIESLICNRESSFYFGIVGAEHDRDDIGLLNGLVGHEHEGSGWRRSDDERSLLDTDEQEHQALFTGYDIALLNQGWPDDEDDDVAMLMRTYTDDPLLALDTTMYVNDQEWEDICFPVSSPRLGSPLSRGRCRSYDRQRPFASLATVTEEPPAKDEVTITPRQCRSRLPRIIWSPKTMPMTMAPETTSSDESIASSHGGIDTTTVEAFAFDEVRPRHGPTMRPTSPNGRLISV